MEWRQVDMNGCIKKGGNLIEESDMIFPQFPNMEEMVKGHPLMEESYKDLVTADKIARECNRIKNLLQEKNKKYGNSAFNNGIVFDVPPLTALKARINDKVSRIKNALPGDEEDPIDDLCGYLILYMIQRKEEGGNIL